MKKLLKLSIVFWLISSLISCGHNDSKPYKFHISGKLSNSNNEWIIIQKLSPNGTTTIDSTMLEDDGSFSMEFNDEQSSELYILSIVKFPWKIALQLNDKEDVFLKGDAYYLNKKYEIEGSEGSKKLQILSSTIERYTDEADSIYFAYREQAADSSSLQLRKLTDSLLLNNYRGAYNFIRNFCLENKNNLAGILGLYSRYGQELILDDEKDFDIFGEVAAGTKSNFPDNIHVIKLNEVVDNRLANIEHSAEIEKNLSTGKVFPGFELQNPDGKKISTKDFLGKYLIVSFWLSKHKTSWDNNAGLKILRKKFNTEQVEMVSVGMDRDKLTWVNNIALDNLEWNNVLATDETLDNYNLKDTPRLFLIDPEGIIIGKDFTIDSLSNTIKTILK